MTLAVVLHELGDPDAGAGWRAALPSEAWEAPDLPGHGVAPAPRHGAYDPMGPVTLARWRLAAHPPGHRLAVGVGGNAMGALLLAAGGACEAVAVVDGLWGPWAVAPDARVEVMYAQVRAILADPACAGPAPATGLDPRTAHGYAVVATPRMCERFWASVTCPALFVETPASATPPEERAERLTWFGGPTTLVEVPSATPADVVPVIDRWWGAG